MHSEPNFFIKQHLIDPEVCIRCNTCEETCPVDAITHDGRNYVVDAAICNACNACISPCPTGSIDHWFAVPKAKAYTLKEQFGWDELPTQNDAALRADTAAVPSATVAIAPGAEPASADAVSAEAPQANAAVSPSSLTAPWSAAPINRPP